MLSNHAVAALAAYEWVQLHTADPGPDGLAHVAVLATRQAASLTVAGGRVLVSTTDLVWDAGLADETITHVSLWDAAANGHCGVIGACRTAVPVHASDPDLTIPAGLLILSAV